MPRRAFIFRTLARDHMLPFRKLREEFGGDLAYQSLADDVKFFTDLGIEMEMAKDEHGEIVIIDRATRHDETTEVRRDLQKKGKRAIGNVCLGLICGIPPALTKNEREEFEGTLSTNSSTLETKDPATGDSLVEAAVNAAHALNRDKRVAQLRESLASIPAHPPDTKEIDEALIGQRAEPRRHGHGRLSAAQGNAAFKALEVHWKLRTFWGEHNRAVTMDAGTTNDAIANLLKEITLPMLVGTLQRLTVCTNSRGIFNVLGVAKVLTKTIMIGGEQVARSEAVAGRMSELFIKSAGVLQFGLGIMGATVVDLDPKNLVACSDTFEEANLKTLLYSKSSLRILVVDHTKLRQDGQMRASYPFAAIHPDQLDLLVTNAPVPAGNTKHARQEHRQNWEKFFGSVNIIRQHGVPVLIANHHEGDGETLISDQIEFPSDG